MLAGGSGADFGFVLKQLSFDVSVFKWYAEGGMGKFGCLSYYFALQTLPEATLQQEVFIIILVKSDHRLGCCLDLFQMQFVKACVVNV